MFLELLFHVSYLWLVQTNVVASLWHFMCAPLRYWKRCCKKFICNWARIYDPLTQSFSILDNGLGSVDSKQKTRFLFRYLLGYVRASFTTRYNARGTKFEVPIRMRLGRSTAHLASPFVWIFKFSTPRIVTVRHWLSPQIVFTSLVYEWFTMIGDILGLSRQTTVWTEWSWMHLIFDQ